VKAPLSPRARARLDVFAKKVGRGINRFGMIADGERLLVGVSGGKDSLALCLALAERQRWVPVRYSCEALLIDWREHPIPPLELERVRGFLDALGIPCQVVQAGIHPRSVAKPFDCYICSRNRKRILFREAERRGIATIALGHHLDDIIETTLMNLCFRGEFSTMMPVQRFFGGRMKIVRPLCEVQESDILRLGRAVELPAVSSRCPKKDSSQRMLFKEIIRRVKRVNRHVKENLYNAPWRINLEYLPVSCDLPEDGHPEYIDGT
jgi:tRNA 2-thiocytidine biosynthesis protein TtcA